jgi:outer membrane protein OmpU
MKKILLGSSALCAVAIAGPAFAQTANEPVKLGIGGYFNSAYGNIVSQNGGSSKTRRRDDIDTDAILNFKGSTKLDNGIVVGASMQLRSIRSSAPTGTSAPNSAKSASVTTTTPAARRR